MLAILHFDCKIASSNLEKQMSADCPRIAILGMHLRPLYNCMALRGSGEEQMLPHLSRLEVNYVSWPE